MKAKGIVIEPQKRNFFAHARPEGNVTYCKVERVGDNKKVMLVIPTKHLQKIKR
jgi:hypothetical protein